MGIAQFASIIAIVSFGVISAASMAGTLTVTSLDDSGGGTLRETIAAANASPGEGIIQFQEGLSGTISLQSALPSLAEDLQILGPGSDVITISGSESWRVFEVEEDVTATISGLTVRDGNAETGGDGGLGLGGCIWNRGSLLLSEAVITACTADLAGGGIANDGDIVIQRSTVSANSATGEEETFGGAVDNFGVARIEASTIWGNTADSGGGIANGQDGQLTLINSTLSGNSAEFFGGGLDNFLGSVSLLQVTLARNTIDEFEGIGGGGIYSDGAVAIKNTLIAENAFNDCVNDGGAFDSIGSNFDTDGTCPGFSQSTPAALSLGPLADNGGMTATHALGPDSAALDAATDCTELDGVTPVTVDQRGIARPQGEACDVGAFERVPGDGGPEDLIFADRFQAP